MAGAPIRGSDVIKSRFGPAELERLIDSTQLDGVNLVDFFPKGIPNPDGGWGIWHVAPGSLPKLIDTLIKAQHVPNIRIFPKGIPVPDVFEVQFEAGSARIR